jgi:murein DD-endopeptidase MepM/ murein hydrolase activator NlpD
MGNKEHSGYRIVIVPEDGRDSTTISMSTFRFRLLQLSLVVVVGILLLVLFFWSSYFKNLNALNELNGQFETLKEQAGRVEKVEQNLIEMDKYVRYIRLAMSLTDEEQPPALEDFLRNDSLKKSYELSADSKSFENIPNIVPVSKAWVSRTFSVKEKHFGVDYAAAEGELVRSPAQGLVIDKSYDEYLGNTVTIDHGNGFVTRFAHCKTITVEKGKTVLRGETVATVGNSGKSSSGPHLHFELKKDGKPVDPQLFIVKGL